MKLERVLTILSERTGKVWLGNDDNSESALSYDISDRENPVVAVNEDIVKLSYVLDLVDKFNKKADEDGAFEKGDQEVDFEIMEEDDFSDKDEVIAYLTALGKDNIVKMMNKYPNPYWMFPSQWPSSEWGPYPGLLAEALVASSENESVTDLIHVYYSNRNLSPEAIEIFKNNILGDKFTSIDMLTQMGGDYVAILLENEPALFKQILLEISDTQLSSLRQGIIDTYPGAENLFQEILEVVGLEDMWADIVAEEE